MTETMAAPGLTTFQAAGGSQALRRTEVVLVSLDGAAPIAVRRPELLGAILIKARAVAKRRKDKLASDRQDLIRLLGYVEDPRALAGDLAKTERAWLLGVEEEIGFDDAALAALFPASALQRARQAFILLTRGASR